MALKRPSWIKEEKKPVADQITIVVASPMRTGKADMRGPIGKRGSAPDEMEEQSGIGMAPIPMTRNTGAGDDGVVQPGAVAGDVHEGEIVIDAETSSKIPEDIMQALVDTFKGGATSEITNALRQSLGIPERPGYSLGSFAKKVGGAIISPFGSAVNAIIGATPNPANPTIPNRVTPPPVITDTPGRMTPIKVAPNRNDFIETNNRVAPNLNNTPQTWVNRLAGRNSTTTQPVATRTMPAEDTTEVSPIVNRVAPPVAGPAVRTITEQPPVTNTIPTLGDISNTATTPVPSQGGAIANRNLTRLDKIAAGEGEADQNITDATMRRYNTQAATSLASGDQQIAGLGNDVPDIVKQSLMAQNRSGVRSQGSELLGNLALNAQQNAQNAANQAAGLGLTADQQQFNQAATLRTEALNNAKLLMEAGIEQNLDGIVSSFARAGININPAALMTTANRQNFADGMDLITKGIASGFSDEQIIGSLRANGIDPSIFGTSATGGSGVEGIISSNRTASNTLDSMINSIQSSTILTTEEKAQAIAYYKYLITNPQDPGLEVVLDPASGQYVVRAKAGTSTASVFAGDINGPDAAAVISEGPSNPYYSSVITQKAQDLITRGDTAGIISLANSSNPGDKAVYDQVRRSAKSWVPMTAAKADGKGATFTDPPQSGTVINYGGRTMLVIGSNTESMYAVDITDGSIHQYYASPNNKVGEEPVDAEKKKSIVDSILSMVLDGPNTGSALGDWALNTGMNMLPAVGPIRSLYQTGKKLWDWIT